MTNTKPKVYVGIDPSKHLGIVAMSDEQTVVAASYVEISDAKWNDTGERRAGLLDLCRRVECLLVTWSQRWDIVAVVLEDYAPAFGMSKRKDGTRGASRLNPFQIETVAALLFWLSAGSERLRDRIQDAIDGGLVGSRNFGEKVAPLLQAVHGWNVSTVTVEQAKRAVGVDPKRKATLSQAARKELGLRKTQKSHGMKDVVRLMVGRLTNLDAHASGNREQLEAFADATATAVAGWKRYKWERATGIKFDRVDPKRYQPRDTKPRRRKGTK